HIGSNGPAMTKGIFYLSDTITPIGIHNRTQYLATMPHGLVKKLVAIPCENPQTCRCVFVGPRFPRSWICVSYNEMRISDAKQSVGYVGAVGSGDNRGNQDGTQGLLVKVNGVTSSSTKPKMWGQGMHSF